MLVDSGFVGRVPYVDDWGGCVGALIVLAIVIWAIYAVLLSFAYVGMTVLIAIEFVAHGLLPIGITNPTVAWLLLGILVGGAVGFALGFQRAGKKSAVPVVGMIGAVIFVCLLAASGSAPTPSRQTTSIAPVQYISLPSGGSQWLGMVGSSPASLDLIQQPAGGWAGRITYQGVVEELAVSTKDGGAIVLVGKSYRRFKGNGSFALDTFFGQLSVDGQRMQGPYVDSAGKRGQWSLARTERTGPKMEPKPQESDVSQKSAQKSDSHGDVEPATDRATEEPNVKPPVQGSKSPSLEEMAKQVDAEIDNGNYDRALVDAERAVRLYPGSARAQALLEKVRRIRSILK
jgi:hypothetical protein